MIDKIEALLSEVEQMSATNTEELEALRIKFLSKKGVIPSLMDDFRNVPSEQKREIGVKINELKQKTTEKINLLKDQFENKDSGFMDIDLTRTAYPISLGSRHPISIVKEEINDIFKRLGFSISEGPEVEDDWHVFSSLNFADDHPLPPQILHEISISALGSVKGKYEGLNLIFVSSPNISFAKNRRACFRSAKETSLSIYRAST
jgi:phenylalanyl-tRNA synthetase alpha chain